MGNKPSSTSTVNQNYETNIVNKSDIEVMNKQLNNFASETIMDSAKACSASISQLQDISFAGMKVAGDLNIGKVEQNQDSAISFSCVQSDKVRNDVAQGFVTDMMSQLENNYDANIVDKMAAAADAEGSSSFGSTGGPDVDSTVNMDYKYNSRTETSKKISNVVQNEVNNTFKNSTVSECLASAKQNQKISFENVDVGGDATIEALSQSQAVEVVANCSQISDATSTITNNVASSLGLEVKETSTTTKETDMTGEATSVSSAGGIGDLLGGCCAPCGCGGIEGFFSVCCGIILCLMLLMVVVKFVLPMMSNSGGGETSFDSSDFNGGGLSVNTAYTNLNSSASTTGINFSQFGSTATMSELPKLNMFY